ncbi:MAG: cellulase family glycosylhydrolase [Firmicutes bacterium]|nr:cellulase family glycosylhydrolase [Bacillota bacterium]
MLSEEYFDDIRGVVYIPAQAYNAYQMWRDYDGAVTRRDFGYARSIGFNAVRLWLSYEYWLVQKDGFKRDFEDLLSAADEKGIRVMPSLFECCGKQPTAENIEDTNPVTATAISSPGGEIETNPCRWCQPYSYIDWFMGLYKNDQRLLAIELTNEPSPNRSMQFEFAKAILLHAAGQKGSVPLTLGSAKMIFNVPFVGDMLDILQYHKNFALTEEEFKDGLRLGELYQKMLKKPVWLTEWQRLRSSSIGWDDNTVVDDNDLMPNHGSMAGLIKKHNVCGFMWSLMLRPAYLLKQREHGAFSGIFHEDGSVYSLVDAKAVSYNESFIAPENPCVPERFKPVLKHK